MKRKRAKRSEAPAYPSAGEVLGDRREFLKMVAKIMAGAAVLGPAVALAGAPDEPVQRPGQAPVVPAEPPEFPPLEGDVIAVEPPKTRGVVKMPDPPVTGGVPRPPDPVLPGEPPLPYPPDEPPTVGCPPDEPPTGGVAPVPEP